MGKKTNSKQSFYEINQLIEKFNLEVSRLNAAYNDFLKSEGERYLNRDKETDTFSPSLQFQAYLIQVAQLLELYQRLKQLMASQLSQQEINYIEASVIFASKQSDSSHFLKYIPEFQNRFIEKLQVINTELKMVSAYRKRDLALNLGLVLLGFAVTNLLVIALAPFLSSIMSLFLVACAVGLPIMLGVTLIPALIHEKKIKTLHRDLNQLNSDGDHEINEAIDTNPILQCKQRFFASTKACFSNPIAMFRQNNPSVTQKDQDNEDKCGPNDPLMMRL